MSRYWLAVAAGALLGAVVLDRYRRAEMAKAACLLVSAAAGAFLGCALAVLEARGKQNTRPKPRKRFHR